MITWELSARVAIGIMLRYLFIVAGMWLVGGLVLVLILKIPHLANYVPGQILNLAGIILGLIISVGAFTVATKLTLTKNLKMFDGTKK